jgi:hypothetical protein
MLIFQQLHADYETESKSFLAILVSSSYAITSPAYRCVSNLNNQKRAFNPNSFTLSLSFRASYASGTKVYSGDFTDPSAKQHKVTKVVSNGLVSIMRICPLVSLIENVPFVIDLQRAYLFDVNTDAQVVFYKRSTRVRNKPCTGGDWRDMGHLFQGGKANPFKNL